MVKREIQNTSKFYDGLHEVLNIVLNLSDYTLNMIEISSIAKRKTQNTPKFCDGLHKALSIVLNLIDYILP